LVLDITVLGKIPDPHTAALAEVSRTLFLLTPPTPHLLLECPVGAIEKGQATLPAGPLVPELTPEDALCGEVPLELLTEGRIPVGPAHGMGLPLRLARRSLAADRAWLGRRAGLFRRRKEGLKHLRARWGSREQDNCWRLRYRAPGPRRGREQDNGWRSRCLLEVHAVHVRLFALAVALHGDLHPRVGLWWRWKGRRDRP
jgi:hypothetical protein